MNRSIPLLPINLLPVVLLFLLGFPIATECADLIEKTCKKTPHHDLCVSSLQSSNQSSRADVKGLASIMANITLSNATDTLSYIQLLINQTTDSDLERRLDYCGEVYIQVVEYILPQAIDALVKGQYGFADYGMSDAGSETDSCQDKISKFKLPVTDRNKLVHDLAEVTEAICKILLKGG
ncbi:hypothetical protein Tsubulata_029658 [Turnera subulata]|uniref:Pectinesterase inhibitor domain-containing protein n=1 Tax=Turnera subulata TaxID=218843 RepID=A0A9Q0FT39_9ROSI|nr:hypothetical protein Tsubulata_029658 [Turnera subulata]